MKATAIIQARMGSTRLPGKILEKLAGKTALEHLIERLGYARKLQQIVLATTLDPKDDVVEKFCTERNILCFRGSENDVLDRYYQAALRFGADPVVRVTADCPVIDPRIVDELIDGFKAGNYDVYGLGGEFPDGLDCTVFSFRALEKTWREANLPSEREHVGPYMSHHPELFKNGAYIKYTGLAHHRWTLDEPRDLVFLQAIYERLYQPGKLFVTEDILELLAREPHLAAINSDIIRNEGYLKSLRKDAEYLKDKDTAK